MGQFQTFLAVLCKKEVIKIMTMERCKVCGGSGQSGALRSPTCATCDGAGVVDIPSDYVRCKACGGSGQSGSLRSPACATCGGAGKVPNEVRKF